MDTFSFVIHPIDLKRDIARKYPLLAAVLPTRGLDLLARFWPPVYLSHVTGARSRATGNESEGWLVACPFSARQALQLPTWTVYNKIIKAGRLAERLGARILGLGAFTSVIGDAGLTVSKHIGIPVTTGHSLTVAMAVEALHEAARSRGRAFEAATVAVVGATGSIGRACAQMLAPFVERLILIGRAGSRRSEQRLAQVRALTLARGVNRVSSSLRVEAIREADMVLSTTSAAQPIIQPPHLKQGAIVCDVALPPDVSPSVARERPDVLCIAGGVVDVPGEVDFGFDFGLPPGKTYACMAETMVLAIDGRYVAYSLGKQIQLDKVRAIARLARKHGFCLTAVS